MFSSVQSLSRVGLFATPWIAARQASLSITNSQSSLKLTCIELVMPSSYLILCRPLLLLPPMPPSIRVFSNESTIHMRWPKYWSFNFSIIPSNEHLGLISFRMDWLDILSVQECRGRKKFVLFSSLGTLDFLSICLGIDSLTISFRIFQFIVIHSQGLWHSQLWSTVKGFDIVNKAEIDIFSGTLLLFWWSSRCYQFDLWFLCLF